MVHACGTDEQSLTVDKGRHIATSSRNSRESPQPSTHPGGSQQPECCLYLGCVSLDTPDTQDGYRTYRIRDPGSPRRGLANHHNHCCGNGFPRVHAGAFRYWSSPGLALQSASLVHLPVLPIDPSPVWRRRPSMVPVRDVSIHRLLLAALCTCACAGVSAGV